MANLIRASKLGSNWTLNDLDACHIEICEEKPIVFFSVNLLLFATTNSLVMTNNDRTDFPNSDARRKPWLDICEILTEY